MRLQRALARAGVTSRRRAEDLIRRGIVRVNGQVATIGQSVDPEVDVIVVKGQRVRPAASAWVLLHKPVGYVVSRGDPRGRPTVFELVPDIPGLTYVGRLDLMTSGVLLLTTDGKGAHRLMHPKFAVERTYHVLVHGRPAHEIRRALGQRHVLDGRAVNIVDYTVTERGPNTALTLVLAEGRYRIVRRLCELLHLKVERLVRLSYGPVRLGRLEPGKWRHLTKAELRRLPSTREG
jgi:23S rRNA pseudouridine2605 synthase